MGQVVVYLFNRECCLHREWPESLPFLPTILVHFQTAGSKVKKKKKQQNNKMNLRKEVQPLQYRESDCDCRRESAEVGMTASQRR